MIKPNISATKALLIYLIFISGISLLNANNVAMRCASTHTGIRVDSTAGDSKDKWKTYRDHKYNFEFQYPALCTNMRIKDKDPAKVKERQQKHGKGNSYPGYPFYTVTFEDEAMSCLSVSIYLNSRKIDLKELAFRVTGAGSSRIKWEPLTVDTHQAIRVMYESFAGGYTGIRKDVFIQRDGKVFRIFLMNPVSATYDEEIDRIVSRFRFTGSTVTNFELNDRAIGLLRNRQYKEAIALWKKMCSEYPGYAESLNNLGYAYYLDEQYGEAKKVLLRVVKKFPKRKIAYKNLAECYEALDDDRGALIYYRQFLRIYPDYKFKDKINRKIIALEKSVRKNDLLTGKTITDNDYGFEITYRGDFLKDDPKKYYLKDRYHMDYMKEHGAAEIFSLVLSNREYLNSNLRYAYLSVGVKENVTDFSDCYPENLNGAGEITRFGGIDFSKTVWGDSAPGGRHNDLAMYVAIRKNRAFFFIGVIRTFGIGFTDEQMKAMKEGYLYEVNINEIMAKFETIVSTVRFRE